MRLKTYGGFSTKELDLFEKETKVMSVQEVADVLGVTAEAIKKHIRELYPEIIKNGVKTFLNEKQVAEIKQRMIPTTSVVGATTDYEMEIMTQKVIAYHIQKAKEYKQRAEIAEKQLAEQKPMVDGYQTFLATHNSFSMQEASAMLKDKNGKAAYGRNSLIDKLRDEEILLSKPKPAIPYREFIDRGYFEVKTTVVNGISCESTLIFPKGLDYIAKKLGLIIEYGEVA